MIGFPTVVQIETLTNEFLHRFASTQKRVKDYSLPSKWKPNKQGQNNNRASECSQLITNATQFKICNMLFL